jgi:acetyl-CoA C-acetyltransferase
MGKRVAIVGTGQTNHCSIRRDVNGQELIREAVTRALADAELTIQDIDGVVIGNMDHFESINYVDCWSIDGTGGFMKPVIKLTTGGTTGTTLAIGGYHMVASGMFDRLLVIGWEKNSESDTTGAINTATDPFIDRAVFGGAVAGLALDSNAYMAKYGATVKDAARVTVRDRKNACNNPHAHLREEVSIEDVMQSDVLSDPLRLLDMCPRSDGACAVIYASEDVAEKITPKPAWVLGTANRHTKNDFCECTDNSTLESLVIASKELYQKLGVKEPRKEFDMVEMYQPFSWAGLIWLEDLGICKKGEAPQLLWDGVTDMDGEIPFNPSGGVITTNPIGATGLIRCAEVAKQIMGRAGDHQVPDVNFALATGFGGCYWSDVLAFGSKKPE